MSTKKINGVYITTPKQQSDPGGGVPEAPKDGHIYGRKDGDWEKVQGGGESHPYLSLERLRRYLYRVTFDSLQEENENNSPVLGACSAYVANGKLYRNFDYYYDNAASFVVRTKAFEGMSMITGLNDGQMDDDIIAQLPYRMVDGRNNDGIMVSVHLLFNDWNYTGAGNKSIPLTRLPYEILSRVKSMATISTDLADVLGNFSVTSGMGDYLLQCLVTDGTTTYAVVPPTSDNQSYELVNATSYPKMSNFRYVARAEVSRVDMDLQTRPTGIERFNAMPCALADLRFTKAYENPDRLSEFIGIDGTTKASSDAELLAIYQLARAEYLVRQRDGKTWQTMHSVVYGDKMEELFIQENWDDGCINTNIPEAPVDGKIYGRKDASWVEVGQPINAPLKFTANGAATLGVTRSPYTNPTLYISSDGTIWEVWDLSDISLMDGESVYMKGDNPHGRIFEYRWGGERLQASFKITGEIYCEGNIMSLLGETITEIPSVNCFENLFKNCQGLLSAPELPAITLENYCYQGMFSGCSSLSEVVIKATDISAIDCLKDWLKNTAASGVIYCDPSMVATFEADSSTPSGWTVKPILTLESLDAKVTDLESNLGNKEDKNIIDSDTSTTAVSEAMVVGKTYKYMPSAGVATLAFTLTAPTETDVVKFWRFKFKSGATATEFTPPSGLYWAGGEQLVPEANTIYEVMIDEDYCVSVLSFKQATA